MIVVMAAFNDVGGSCQASGAGETPARNDISPGSHHTSISIACEGHDVGTHLSLTNTNHSFSDTRISPLHISNHDQISDPP